MNGKRKRAGLTITTPDEIEQFNDEHEHDNASSIPSSLPNSPKSDSEIITKTSPSIIQQLTLDAESGRPLIRDPDEAIVQPITLSQPTSKPKAKRSKRSPISTNNSRDIRAMLQTQSRNIEQNKKSSSSSSSNGSHSTSTSTSTSSTSSSSWQHVDIPSLMQYVGITNDDATLAAELQSYEASSTQRVLRSQAKLMNTRPLQSIVDTIKSPEIRDVKSPEIILSTHDSLSDSCDSDHENPLDVTVVTDSLSNDLSLNPIERASTVVNGNVVDIDSSQQSHLLSCSQPHVWLAQSRVSRITQGMNQCVVATAPGWYRNYNQDDGMIIESHNAITFAVCDGHGTMGETASKTACDMLTTKVALAMCQSSDSEVVAKRVVTSFEETQKRLLDIANIEHDAFIQTTTKHRAQQSQTLQTISSNFEPKSPQISHQPLIPISRSPNKKAKINSNTSTGGDIPMDCDYGTTAVVVACCSEWTVIANCGDSRACVWRGTGSTKPYTQSLELLFNTKDHTPSADNPIEVSRVLQEGGAVLKDTNPYRVYPASMTLEEARSRSLTLNMSRALGHRKLKECGVSAEPDVSQVTTVVMNNQSLVICAGSDGLWDQLSVDEVRVIVQRHLPCLDCAVSALLHEADTQWMKRGSGDNITVALCLQRYVDR